MTPVCCDWCGEPIRGSNLQIVAAKGFEASGVRRAIFHPTCGTEVIALCGSKHAPKSIPRLHSRVSEAEAEELPASTRKPKGKTGARRGRPRKPDTEGEAPREVRTIDAGEVLDLHHRGFRSAQIAARLRAPYREVERILEAA